MIINIACYARTDGPREVCLVTLNGSDPGLDVYVAKIPLRFHSSLHLEFAKNVILTD